MRRHISAILLVGLRDYGTGTWEGGDGAGCDHKRPDGQGKPRPELLDPPAGWSKRDATVRTAYNTCAKCGARRVDSQIGIEKLHDCLGWATGNRCGECHVCVIVEVFRLVREVLADDGTLWLNLGDSYANDGKWGGSTGGKHVAALHGDTGIGRQKVTTGLKPKDLCGMPWRVALALQSDGWWLRQDIIWHKPNPMPESINDRCTKSHEYLFLLAKSQRYYFDAEAIREPGIATKDRGGSLSRAAKGDPRISAHNHSGDPWQPNPAGRNARTVWSIASQPFYEAHFATFPQKLVTPCILAGTSEMGHCPECGARWVRVVEREKPPEEAFSKARIVQDGNVKMSPLHRSGKASGQKMQDWLDTHPTKTTGWRATCDCNAEPVPDVVLDPFSGAGTTSLVAKNLGRRYIAIELNPDYDALAEKRTRQGALDLAPPYEPICAPNGMAL